MRFGWDWWVIFKWIERVERVERVRLGLGIGLSMVLGMVLGMG